MAMLGLGPDFFELVWDDVSIDEDKWRASLDSESDSAEEEGDLLAYEVANGDAKMEA